MDIVLTQEQPKHYSNTEDVVRLAFEREAMSDHKEHQLVSRLRLSDAFIPALSLVALHQEEVVGQCLLTRVHVGEAEALALAPISVLPGYQNHGLGTRLIEAAIARARVLGYQAIIVLGHPTYYPRFGFVPAAQFSITAPFEVPQQAFMVLPLQTPLSMRGEVRYSKPFMMH
ncbi:hypothetical protein CH76_10365 [Lysinibacillus sp. BF-4]|uniref:GNAT family N-acetyltransferase n=1 Tax=Lysinibacillus sp. BF-4 TaxID=1473546 RepID=UPI00050019B1|nr:N-acetyltransferase [Lysinibacillus sp. BF-4]KFL42784.1 hypothetical protein CH76_10365 [Lysinibacillus sp. BF-4]